VINYLDNNQIKLIGTIVSDKSFSHEVYGEGFYSFDLEVPRLSDTSDVIPVIVSERLIAGFDFHVGQKVVVDGQYRSYNNMENEKNKLVLTVFVKEIRLQTEEDANVNSNEIILNGFICKKPIYRTTPFGREIADILLAVNRAYNKSDYIPCIAWGRNARFCQNMEVGTEVKLIGRVQSRTYEKKYEDGTVENKVAYEVSIGSLEVVKNSENNNNEEENLEEAM
jgi:single-stranded DNA-binding protein